MIKDDELLFREEVFRVVGAAMSVANNLGCGFLEAVYQEALEIEFRDSSVPFEAQKAIDIFYKGIPLNKSYVADFLCYGAIIVEIKAIKEIGPLEEAQIINYLKATKKTVGVIINFGGKRMEWKRYVLTERAATTE